MPDHDGEHFVTRGRDYGALIYEDEDETDDDAYEGFYEHSLYHASRHHYPERGAHRYAADRSYQGGYYGR